MRKADSPYRSGPFYLIKRGDRFHIHGTHNGELIRVSANTDSLKAAKIALDELATEYLSGWREREINLSSSWKLVAKALCGKIRHAAKTRGLLFQISAFDVYDLMKASDFRCSISGIPFSRRLSKGTGMDPWAPSIDRIENRHGYLKDNIRIVCVATNLAMNHWGYDTLLRLARAVVSNATHVRPEIPQNLTPSEHTHAPETAEVIELIRVSA